MLFFETVVQAITDATAGCTTGECQGRNASISAVLSVLGLFIALMGYAFPVGARWVIGGEEGLSRTSNVLQIFTTLLGLTVAGVGVYIIDGGLALMSIAPLVVWSVLVLVVVLLVWKFIRFVWRNMTDAC